jgi:hypothetical protein
MISNSTRTDREQASYLRDILVIVILIGGTWLLLFGYEIMSYRTGLTLYRETWSAIILSLFLPLAYLALAATTLLIQFVRVLSQGTRFGIKRACLQISFMVITVLVFYMSPRVLRKFIPPQRFFTKGLIKTMKERADVSAIHKWLYTTDTERAGTFEVNENRWPEAIRELSPKLVLVTREANDRVYVRLIWRSGVTGDWGIVIGVSSTEVPILAEHYKSEYRRQWLPNAFVWKGIYK